MNFYNQECLNQRLDSLRTEPRFWMERYLDVNPQSRTEKVRLIGMPNPAMKRLQKEYVWYLRANLVGVNLSYSTACRPGTSIVDDVGQHRQNRFFYLTDLKDAFQHVRLNALTQTLLKHDRDRDTCESDVRDFLWKYCFQPDVVPGLILGSPSSNDLFNIHLAANLDENIVAELTDILGFTPTYTRYLDDIKVSIPHPVKASVWEDARRTVRQQVEHLGFTINHRKSLVIDLKKARIVVNGIGLEYGGRMFLPRYYLRETRRLIDQLHRQFPTRTWSNQDQLDQAAAKIRGRMQMFEQIRRANGSTVNSTEQMLLDHFHRL